MNPFGSIKDHVGKLPYTHLAMTQNKATNIQVQGPIRWLGVARESATRGIFQEQLARLDDNRAPGLVEPAQPSRPERESPLRTKRQDARAVEVNGCVAEKVEGPGESRETGGIKHQTGRGPEGAGIIQKNTHPTGV